MAAARRQKRKRDDRDAEQAIEQRILEYVAATEYEPKRVRASPARWVSPTKNTGDFVTRSKPLPGRAGSSWDTAKR